MLASSDPPLQTIHSLLAQTQEADIIVVAANRSASQGLPFTVRCIVVNADGSLCVGKRVALSINSSLALLDLSKYDYLLKADDDVVFPPDFLEKNTSARYELVGQGCALLISTSPFLLLCGGRFAEICCDDTYLVEVFQALGCKVLAYTWFCRPMIRKKPHYDQKRMFEFGVDYFKMGSLFAPILYSSLKNSIGESPVWSYLSMGFIAGFLVRSERLPFADRIRRHQIAHLFRRFGFDVTA